MKNDSNNYEAPRVNVIQFSGNQIITSGPYYTGDNSHPAVVGYGPDGKPEYWQDDMETHENDGEYETISG